MVVTILNQKCINLLTFISLGAQSDLYFHSAVFFLNFKLFLVYIILYFQFFFIYIFKYYIYRFEKINGSTFYGQNTFVDLNGCDMIMYTGIFKNHPAIFLSYTALKTITDWFE